MSSDKRNKLSENLIYLVLWTVVFAAPAISMMIRSDNSNEVFEWKKVFSVWKMTLPFFALFLVHNFLIARYFLKKGKRWLYFSLLVIVLVIYPGTDIILKKGSVLDAPPQHQLQETPPPHPQKQHREQPPMGPPPEFRAGQPPKAKGMIPPPKPPMLLDNVAFGKITLALLLIAINLVIKWFYKTRSYTEKMAELKNENLQSQLLYLKHQINPHFFMNTLNNIHALVDIEPEKAKSTIIELSKIMRHVLYDSPNEGVLLNKEIEFLRDYLNIMKIRYQDTVKVVEDFTEDNSGATVPPMLFITFLENAFKHGISYKQESIIETSIKVEDNKILFRCFNTKRNNNSERYGGIGLENATKRLNILYGEECTIEINEDETTYEFKLAIPSQMPSTKEIVSSSIF